MCESLGNGPTLKLSPRLSSPADLPCCIWIEIVDGRVRQKKGFLEVVQRGKAGTIRDWLKRQGYRRDRDYMGGGAHDFVYVHGGAQCS